MTDKTLQKAKKILSLAIFIVFPVLASHLKNFAYGNCIKKLLVITN